MGMKPDHITDVLGILAGILHLGNITFVKAAGAQISNVPSLQAAARLLSLDVSRLSDALTQKFMVLRGEEITTPLTKEQVCILAGSDKEIGSLSINFSWGKKNFFVFPLRVWKKGW